MSICIAFAHSNHIKNQTIPQNICIRFTEFDDLPHVCQLICGVAGTCTQGSDHAALRPTTHARPFQGRSQFPKYWRSRMVAALEEVCSFSKRLKWMRKKMTILKAMFGNKFDCWAMSASTTPFPGDSTPQPAAHSHPCSSSCSRPPGSSPCRSVSSLPFFLLPFPSSSSFFSSLHSSPSWSFCPPSVYLSKSFAVISLPPEPLHIPLRIQFLPPLILS